jgi:hypothetical protein
MGLSGSTILLALDFCLEVDDNVKRQSCHWSMYGRGLVKVYPLSVHVPVEVFVFVQRAIRLLIVETRQIHHCLQAIGEVATTGSPRAACPRAGSLKRWATRSRFCPGDQPLNVTR